MAATFASHGIDVECFDGPVPTPLVATSVVRTGAASGVVVTASHNPAKYNGYKVYVGPSQIVPPTDAEIAARIAEASAGPVGELPRSTLYETIGEPLLDAYVARVASLVPADAPRDIAWTYTAMHGVGAEVVARVLALAGFPAPALVDSQALPDPSFPTVAFPNPEEPGAMDLSLAAARAHGADVIIAKHRNGPTGEINFHINPENLEFSEVDTVHTDSDFL